MGYFIFSNIEIDTKKKSFLDDLRDLNDCEYEIICTTNDICVKSPYNLIRTALRFKYFAPLSKNTFLKMKSKPKTPPSFLFTERENALKYILKIERLHPALKLMLN